MHHSTHGILRRLRPALVTLSASASFALTCAVPGQVTSNSIADHRYNAAHRVMVSDGADQFLVGTNWENGPARGTVRLFRRDPGGWTPLGQPVNDAQSGLTGATAGATPASEVSVAITHDGFVHVTWARSSYPSFYRQYYRVIDTLGNAVSPVIDLSAHTVTGGSAATPNNRRTDSFDIVSRMAPTGQPVVMLCVQGPSNWRNRLVEIAPSGGSWATPSLTVAADLFQSGSSQRVRMSLSDERLHVAYYSNGVPGVVHRVSPPLTSGSFVFDAETALGIGVGHADLSIDITAAPSGGVHALYNHWLSGTQCRLESRVWSPAGSSGSWSSPQVTYQPSVGTDLDWRFTIAADLTGRVFAARYDDQDRLWLDNLTGNGAVQTFEPMYELRGGASSSSTPEIHGTLWPPFNGMLCPAHVTTSGLGGTRITCDELATCDYETGPGLCSYEGRIFFAHTPFPDHTIGLETATGTGMAILLLGFSPIYLPGIACNCPVLVDPVVYLPILGASPELRVPFSVPPTLPSTAIHAQWAELDSGSACGTIAGLTNRGTLVVP